MSERRSALDGFTRPIRPAQVGVRIAEQRPAAIALLAAWPRTLRVAAALWSVTGLAPPPLGRFAERDGVTVGALAPGRFLVLGGDADLVARFEAALPASGGAMTDLSHARSVLRLQGEAVVPTLAKGVMLDLDPSVFPPGALAQTLLHSMDVLLLRHGADVFDIAVFRGFGVSLAEWLADAAAEFGVAFEH
jgi:methylglutamate dehydrogenase subunit D